MVVAERNDIAQVPINSVADQIVTYYRESPGYLNGPLAGTCHFGFTPDGEDFRVRNALKSMEDLMAQKLGLPVGSKVLDAGCGYGRVATTMASEHGLEVIGVDLIPERLEEAFRFIKLNNASGKVTLLQGNYCRLPIRDSSLSGVYTMETLVHADPLEKALGEFWRVLKPGGRITCFEYSVPPEETLDPIRKSITDSMVEKIGMASIKRFTHNAFPGIFEKAGFENIEVEDISQNVWPTWRWLFLRAINRLPKFLDNQDQDKINLIASLMIWPYRHQLGYKVVTANKPN